MERGVRVPYWVHLDQMTLSHFFGLDAIVCSARQEAGAARPASALSDDLHLAPCVSAIHSRKSGTAIVIFPSRFST
jgi:hypothetical protein